MNSKRIYAMIVIMTMLSLMLMPIQSLAINMDNSYDFLVTESMLQRAEIEDALFAKADELESAEIVSFNKNGDPIYKDGFAGIYADENDQLVYLNTDISKKSLLTADGIIIKQVKYDYNELYKALNAVAVLCMTGEIPNVSEFYIDILSNSIIVNVVKFDASQSKAADALLTKNKVELDMLQFNSVNNYIQPTGSVTAGVGIVNSGRNASTGAPNVNGKLIQSISVGVQKTSGSELGLVLQGHEVKTSHVMKDLSYSSFGSTITKSPTNVGTFNYNGVVTNYELDASYLKLATGDSVSNVVGSSTIKSNSTATNSTSKTVYMLGYKTGSVVSGTVTNTNTYYSMTDTNNNRSTFWCRGIKAKYASQIGDSGGLVYQIVSGVPVWAGVQSCQGGSAGSTEATTHSIFADAAQVASAFGIKVK